jgi:ABC-2 type transport system permease protein
MEASLDLSRWRDVPRGVGYRRWTIISTGLRQLFQLRFLRVVLMLAWTAGAVIAVLAFAFSESIAPGSWIERLAATAGPRGQALSSVFGAFVLLYPDICIGGVFTLLFWFHSFIGFWLSLFALTALVPRLITRDRATDALVIYLSRPLTSADYLLSKLGTIVGVLVYVWIGPLLLGALLSMALAPNLDFIVYALEPLGRVLLFSAIAVVTLAAITLGVSATSRTGSKAILVWVGLWVILGALASAPETPLWLRRASFTHSLNEVRSGILRPDAALTDAAEVLPITSRGFADALSRGGAQARGSDFHGALASLAAFVALSSVVFLRRLRPE